MPFCTDLLSRWMPGNLPTHSKPLWPETSAGWLSVTRTALWQPPSGVDWKGGRQLVHRAALMIRAMDALESLLALLGLSLSSPSFSRVIGSLQVDHKDQETSFHQNKENSRRCLIQAFPKTHPPHPLGAVETPFMDSRGPLPEGPFLFNHPGALWREGSHPTSLLSLS